MSGDDQRPDDLGQTPWQTIGPFFHFAFPGKGSADLIGGGLDNGARPDLIPAGHDLLSHGPVRGPVRGQVIEITGRVLDGAGQPVPDALLEIWQADADGQYRRPDDRQDFPTPGPRFIGFGRAATAEDGSFLFRSVMPGRVAGEGRTLQAPHVTVSIFARGILRRLVTRMYFEGSVGLEEDPVLALVPSVRRKTLIAAREADGVAYRFDIRVQGLDETVFFDL